MFRHALGTVLLLAPLLACGPGQPPFDEADAIARGQAIAMGAFQQLSGRLQGAIARHGTAGAVAYCSQAALPLVDSLARAQGVRIKRTSDRLRAAHDAPDADEQRRLAEVAAQLAQGARPAEIGAQARLLGDSVAFYQPILIAMPTCLKCHGQPGADIDSLTQAALAQRYPNDRATGYALGDFRGLWSIRWRR